MVSYPQTDMKIPVRPAPAPPSNRTNRTFQRRSSCFDSWDDRNDPFANGNISRSISSQHIGPGQLAKKKPPPRPPPPKLHNSHQLHNSKQDKTNVLTGLFSRSNQRRHSSNMVSYKQVTTKDHNVVVASLIDFDSPSSSPTFTTRSSSDGVSVNSFGSDGSASNNGNTPSGGTASLFESGFEDDFDFFGGQSGNQVKTPGSDQKDPWSVSPQDPFSPPRTQHPCDTVSNSTNSTRFKDLSENQNSTKTNHVGVLKPPPVTSVMPTIIRAKPNRPSAPPKPLQFKQDAAKYAKVGAMQNTNSFNNNAGLFAGSKPFTYSSGDNSREWSPPMPSVPPPPPPVNTNADFPISLPDLPPRKPQTGNKKIPLGIAVYDYNTSHPDDLVFKSNDIIHILKKINDEWLFGEKGDQQGMFPANFIEVIVPLDDSDNASSDVKTVTALYPFSAQQWDDLEFPEGAVIQVLSQINADWLYGEYHGERGQFPASFVDHIPDSLPQRK